MRGRAHKPWLVLGLVVLLLGVAGIALADDPTTTLTGCLKNGKLTNVAVGDQPAKPCKAKEVQVGWNAHGSPGVGSDCTAAPNLVPGADLRGCDLTGVNLTDANLTGANLTGASLGDAILLRTNFTGAIMVGADLSPTADPQWLDIDFTGADLTDADLSGADFRNGVKGVTADGAIFTGADLTDSNWFHASFFGTNLVGADLTRATLGYILMDGANLTRANLSETSWFRAFITSSVLANANLSHATFDEATITSSDLTKADLSNTGWPEIVPTAAVTSSNLSFSTWTDATGRDLLGWRACTCPDLTDSRDNNPAGCVGHLTYP